PSAWPRGMIEIFRTGSAPGVSMPTSACPASWKAVRERSAALMTICRSAPRRIFSIASVKSCCSTAGWSLRAANSAASFTASARSAPVAPGVEAATCSRFTSSASGTERVWIRRISTRPALSGGCTAMRRSKRPGRRSAWSRTSGRLVAPSTMTFVPGSKPPVPVGVLEEVDDLDKLVLGLVDAGDVLEGDAFALAAAADAPRGRAAEAAEHAARTRGRLAAREPDEEADEEQRRREAEDEAAPERAAGVGRLGVDHDRLLCEQPGEAAAVDEGRDQRLAA